MRGLVALALLAGSLGPAAAAGSAFPPFDSQTFPGQLFWLALTFGALYALMSRLALPRMQAIFAERAGRIEAAIQAAKAAQKNAEEAALAQEAALTRARNDGQAIAMAAKAEAARLIDEERIRVESQLNEKLKAADSRIGEVKARAMVHVDEIATEAATALVKQLIGKAPTKTKLAAAITAAAKN
jgi:F-type H+-transporting ATPase subunit b